ncbi:MAG: hypothetical protein HY072_10150, partial [Deltaproteobacteria bacterium]|nr:hypothetical protein [Deltaproteobacteria bacterium]
MGAFFHSAFQKYVDFEMLANAGFCALLTGVESVSEENLKYFVAKNNSIKDLFALGVKSKKAGIFVSQSFIAPEAEATFEPFDRYLSEYPFDSDNSSITLFFPLVYPGTGWWKNPAQYGIEITNRNHYLRGLLFGDDPKHHPVSYSIQIKGRPFSDLSLEFVETKRRVLSKGINLNITDEIALLAIASGQNPHKFHIRQQSAIRRY